MNDKRVRVCVVYFTEDDTALLKALRSVKVPADLSDALIPSERDWCDLAALQDATSVSDLFPEEDE